MSLNIEDLKCCGNCRSFQVVTGYDWDCQSKISKMKCVEHNNSCSYWEFDGIKQEDRIKKQKGGITDESILF